MPFKSMSKKVLFTVLDLEQKCARSFDGTCSGRMTIEHVFGRNCEEVWNCIWLCWYHHLGQGLDKEINRHIAYSQASEDDLNKYPKRTMAWKQEKKYLAEKYGRPKLDFML